MLYFNTGVIVGSKSGTPGLSMENVRTSWVQLKAAHRKFKQVDIEFIPIDGKEDIGMEALLEGNLEKNIQN